jgi:hypothetical protein
MLNLYAASMMPPPPLLAAPPALTATEQVTRQDALAQQSRLVAIISNQHLLFQ